MTGKIAVRLARPDDLVAFFGQLPDTTVRAVVGELDGQMLGLGGYYMAGARAVAFMDLKPEADAYKVTIWREAKRFMARLKVPAVCHADGSRATAPRFLERLGWVENEGFYEWQG